MLPCLVIDTLLEADNRRRCIVGIESGRKPVDGNVASSSVALRRFGQEIQFDTVPADLFTISIADEMRLSSSIDLKPLELDRERSLRV